MKKFMIRTTTEICENPNHHFLSFFLNKYIIVEIKICSSSFQLWNFLHDFRIRALNK